MPADDLPHGLGPDPNPPDTEPDADADSWPATMPHLFGWPSAVDGARQCHECQRWWPPDDVYDFGTHAPVRWGPDAVASNGQPYPLICVACVQARHSKEPSP